jgi:polyisoprenyl-phosphate glycosyltransferase
MTPYDKLKTQTFVSLVIVIDFEDGQVDDYIFKCSELLSSNYVDYEILLIANGISGSILSRVEHVLNQISHIRLLQLNKKVEDDVAVAAGFENAIGDIIISAFYGVHDPELITRFFSQALTGNDILIGVATNSPQSFLYKIFHPRFRYSALKVINFELPAFSTYLLCLSRRAINTVIYSGRYQHQLLIRIAESGYSLKSFEYELNKDSHMPKRGLIRGIGKLIRYLVFTSTRPLRLLAAIGVGSSLLALTISVYSLIIRLVKDQVIEGWTTTVFFSSILFSLLFVMLSMISEYLYRLIEEQTGAREYGIAYEKHSSVMLSEERLNVLHDIEDHPLQDIQSGRDG